MTLLRVRGFVVTSGPYCIGRLNARSCRKNHSIAVVLFHDSPNIKDTAKAHPRLIFALRMLIPHSSLSSHGTYPVGCPTALHHTIHDSEQEPQYLASIAIRTQV